MNPERLIDLYDRVADAPDAVERLRKFVLDLAVRGRLVEQDPADEPADKLLERIEAEKVRLFKAGEIRKPKKLPAVEELPYALPTNWCWSRIRQVTSDHGQKVPDRRFTYIDVSAIDKESGVVSDPKVLNPDEAPSRARKITSKGDVIYSCVRPYLLNIAVIDHEFEPEPIVSTAFAVLNGHGLVLPWYLWIVLRSPFMIESVEGKQRGQAYPAINDKDFSQLPFPLAPLEEQHRIVAKVNDLMALLDRLETTRTQRETTRNRLTTASLTRLTAPETTEADFPTHARFALDNLDQLTTRPEQLKMLRQTILNLAVRGKLVEQDSTEAPASELLIGIEEERARLIKAGEIRKLKPLPALEESDVPFPVPENWSWCRLGSLVLSLDAGWSPRTESHAREGDAWGVLKVSAVSWDTFDPDANKQILAGTEPRLQAQVHKGDFLLSRANTSELVSRAVLVHESPQNLMMSDKIVRLRLATDCNHRFVWLLNNYADYARAHYVANATGVSPSMKNVSRDVILNLPLPLPPLAEQCRIISKVDVLLDLCNQLEKILSATGSTRTRLLEGLLQEALPRRNEAVQHPPV